jgi:hypothetical protein
MRRHRASDARVALLREILLGEEVPHLPDDWVPPPKDEVEEVPPPTVTLSAVGGRAVVVDEAQLLALLDAAGVTPGPDLTRHEFGVILAHAKGGHPMMGPLLTARCELAPLYKLRTAEGRPWRPTPPPAPTTEPGPTT